MAPSRNSSFFTALGDVKAPTHCSKRVGHGFLGVVDGLHISRGLGVYYGTAVLAYAVTVSLLERPSEN